MFEKPAHHSQRADIETSSDKYAQRFSGEAGRYFLDVQTKIVSGFLKDFHGVMVLDVGGGHGQIAVPLVSKGFRVTVAGSSPECRKRLDSLLNHNDFTFVEADLLNLPFAEKSFELVASFRLITHEENWKSQIHELCRISGFSVLIDYPDKRSFNSLYDFFFSLKKKLEGDTRTFRRFTRKEISGEFAKNGFENLRFRPQYFFPMVIHRMIKNYRISDFIETTARILGLTRLFGSPVIVIATRSND